MNNDFDKINIIKSLAPLFTEGCLFGVDLQNKSSDNFSGNSLSFIGRNRYFLRSNKIYYDASQGFDIQADFSPRKLKDFFNDSAENIMCHLRFDSIYYHDLNFKHNFEEFYYDALPEWNKKGFSINNVWLKSIWADLLVHVFYAPIYYGVCNDENVNSFAVIVSNDDNSFTKTTGTIRDLCYSKSIEKVKIYKNKISRRPLIKKVENRRGNLVDKVYFAGDFIRVVN